MALVENNGVGGNRRWSRPPANASDWASFPEIDAEQEGLLRRLGFNRIDQVARLSDREIGVLQKESALQDLDFQRLREKCLKLSAETSGESGGWVRRMVDGSMDWTKHCRETIAFYWHSLWGSEKARSDVPAKSGSGGPLSVEDRDRLEDLPGAGVHVAHLLRNQGIHQVEELGQLTTSEWRALAVREPRLASFVARQLGESEEPPEDPFAVASALPDVAPIDIESPVKPESAEEEPKDSQADSKPFEPIRVERPAARKKAAPSVKRPRSDSACPTSAGKKARKKTAARKKPAPKKAALRKVAVKKARKKAVAKKAASKKAPVKKPVRKKTGLRVGFASTTGDARKKSAASARLLADDSTASVGKKKKRVVGKKTAPKKKAVPKKKSATSKKAALRKKTAASRKKTSRASSKKESVSSVPATAKRLMTTEFSGQAVKYDREVGIVFTKRPSKRDDLKKISGVGAVLEKKLHAFGVYRFRQIATWNKTMINAFDERLNFKGRIEREDWVAQAKVLAKK